MPKELFEGQEYTSRGFPYKEFKDKYGAVCSIQMSSIATEPCLWLGVNGKQSEEFVNEFKASGPYTRMHLTYDQVKKLVDDLNRWLENVE
jgi:hypothetical protein